MAASITIQIEPVSVQIQSGGRASARITLLNKGDTVGQYVLEVKGLDPAWYKLDNTQAGVFPGDKAAIQLSLRPPADALSATYQVTVLAQSQIDPADQIQSVFNLTVQRIGESASARPPEPARPAEKDSAGAAQPTVMRSNAPVPSRTGSAGQVQDTEPHPKESLPQPSPANPAQPVGARPSPSPAVPASFGQAALRASSPSGQLVFSADREGLRLPPDATQSLNLAISNSGGAGIDLELVVKGPPLSWVSLSPAALTLAPGETTLAVLSISIPAQTPAGSYPLAVIAQSAEDAGLTTRLNMMLEVTRPGEISLQVVPVQAEGEMSAEYTLQLSQTGLSSLSVKLSARDESGALDFTIIPAVLNLPVGGKGTSRLTVRSRQAVSGSDSLTYPFTVSALPAGGGAAAANAQGRFIQLSPPPFNLLVQPAEIRDPGMAAYQLRIVNPGQSPVSFRLTASDSDNACVFQFETRAMNLPPRGEASTTLHVTPQAYLNAGEVIHTLRILAQPAGGPGAALTAEVRFIQTAGQAPSLTITPSSQTSAGPASYTVQVSNPRPVPLQIELRAFDSGQLVQFSLDPPSMTIPPMYQASARLVVSPVSDLLAGESKRICAFNVAGYLDNQPSPIIAEGTLLQVPGFTWRKLLPIFIAGVVLLGLGAVAVMVLLYMQFAH